MNTKQPQHQRANQSQAQYRPGDGKGPLNYWTLAAKDTSQHHHAAFPPILLVERKNVRGGEQKVHQTEPGSGGNTGCDQVRDNSSQQHEDLLGQGALLELGEVKANVGADRQEVKPKPHVSVMKSKEPASPAETELSHRHFARSGSGKVSGFVKQEGKQKEKNT